MISKFLGNFFQVFLYQPLFNALIFIYNLLPGHDLGIAVIILTLLIKVLTLPLNVRAFKIQQAMSRIQPQIKEAQDKHKGKPEDQAKAVSGIFKREKVSPFGSIMPILIQLPILLALYQLFWKGLWQENNYLYRFIAKPEFLSPVSLGILDLSQPSLLIALLAGLAQLFQSLTMPGSLKKNGDEAKDKMMAMMQKQTMFIFPLLTIFILVKLPSVLGLYWLATSVFTVLQQYILMKPRRK